MMADKPILFSGPMVRALLAGTKTQTRRALNPQPNMLNGGKPLNDGRGSYSTEEGWKKLRYSKGDRLYVREHWRTFISLDKIAPRHLWWPQSGKGAGVLYIADNSGMSLTTRGERFYGDREGDAEAFGKHRQAMHMPRWASRLTLAVTDVRVERLQDCSDADALAEGVVPVVHRVGGTTRYSATGDKFGLAQHTPKLAYAHLWDSINGEDAWSENPWVAAYTFTIEHGNIDALARAA